MTRELHISDELSLPLDTVTSTLVIYGGKGMGKTNFASVIAEEFATHNLRFSVIDPMGVWWGLRHSADGKGPGVPVLILGGRHGDIPIEATAGAVVADLVVDEDVNTIIDIHSSKEGKTWSRGQRIRFVTDYITRLYERQGEKRNPIMQVIDEAARFAPQQLRANDKDIALCLGAIETITEEGRNVGIGVTLIAQRSARLNKSVAELCDSMFAFRTVGPNSVQAITDWLGEHVPKERWKQITEELRRLPRGKALVVSPGWLEFEGIVQMRLRHTFDSSATPKAGKERRATGKGAVLNLERYVERMAETIEKARADDPKELRRRVKELEIALDQEKKKAPRAAMPAVSVAPSAALEKQYERGYAEGQRSARKLIDQVVHEVARNMKAIAREAGSITSLITDVSASIDQIAAKFSSPLLPHPVPARKPKTDYLAGQPGEREAAQQPLLSSNGGGEHLRPVKQKILDAIAELNALGIEKVPRIQVAFLVGYTNLTSKSFANAISGLRTEGYIDYPDAGTLVLTDAGRAVARAAARPHTPEELHERIISLLEPRYGKILKVLIDAYPNPVERRELAEQCGYTNLTSKGFANSISRLRTLGLIGYPTPRTIQAQPVLFLNAR